MSRRRRWYSGGEWRARPAGRQRSRRGPAYSTRFLQIRPGDFRDRLRRGRRLQVLVLDVVHRPVHPAQQVADDRLLGLDAAALVYVLRAQFADARGMSGAGSHSSGSAGDCSARWTARAAQLVHTRTAGSVSPRPMPRDIPPLFAAGGSAGQGRVSHAHSSAAGPVAELELRPSSSASAQTAEGPRSRCSRRLVAVTAWTGTCWRRASPARVTARMLRTAWYSQESGTGWSREVISSARVTALGHWATVPGRSTPSIWSRSCRAASMTAS
uniref:RacE protein n=1 Tax=Streptomyces ribosidificus TaxID=80859 RepID=Q4R0V5_STRRI|nr:RacE protein [Streptomyces ribosidificus]